MSVRRVVAALVALAVIVTALLDPGWIPAVLLLCVLLVAVPYAVAALAAGQRGWFDREHRDR